MGSSRHHQRENKPAHHSKANDNCGQRPGQCGLRHVFALAATHRGSFDFKPGLKVNQIITELDRHGLDFVTKKHQDLTPGDIETCRSIALHHIPWSLDYRRNNTGNEGATKILFDENTPHRALPELASAHMQLAHVAFRGLMSRPDEDVWALAKAEKFKAVITNDFDFFSILAIETLRRIQKEGSFDRVDISDLPLVAAIAPCPRRKENGTTRITSICRANLDRVRLEADNKNRSLACLIIGDTGVVTAVDARAIYKLYVRAAMQDFISDTPVFDEFFMNRPEIDTVSDKFKQPRIKFTHDPAWEQRHIDASVKLLSTLPAEKPATSRLMRLAVA